MKNILALILYLLLSSTMNQGVAATSVTAKDSRIISPDVHVQTIPNQTYQIGEKQGSVTGLSSTPLTLPLEIPISTLRTRTGDPHKPCPNNYVIDVSAEPLGFGQPPEYYAGTTQVTDCSIADSSLIATLMPLKPSDTSLRVLITAHVNFNDSYNNADVKEKYGLNPNINYCDVAAQQFRSVTLNYNLKIICKNQDA